MTFVLDIFTFAKLNEIATNILSNMMFYNRYKSHIYLPTYLHLSRYLHVGSIKGEDSNIFLKAKDLPRLQDPILYGAKLLSNFIIKIDEC